MKKPRLVCWYSHGAASLIATKLAIKNQPKLYPDHEVIVACIYIQDEMQEPERDSAVEDFLGQKIVYLKDEKYNASVDTVIKKTRYMSGVYGARCTKELKKAVRIAWQREDDVHVFGFDCKEGERRINNLYDTEPDIDGYFPLVDEEYTKQDCFSVLTEAGLSMPKMYLLGYHNNNCIGCLKAGGAGYWNKIRIDFPEIFKKRSEQEKLLNVAMVSMSRDKFMRDYPVEFEKMVDEWEDRYKSSNKKRANGEVYIYKVSLIPLRYLPPSAGSHRDLDIGDCGFICEIKERS